MPVPVAAIVAAGAGLAAAGANAGATAGRNRKARQWQEQQWRRETSYNKPIMQRQRLVEAGLNPNMMYGSGGVQNTAQAQNITPEAPNMSPIQTTGSNIIQAMVAAKQMKKIDAETNYIDSRTSGQSLSNAVAMINKEIMEMKDPAWQGNYAQAFAKKRFAELSKKIEFLTESTVNQHALGSWNKARYDTFKGTGIDINKDDLPTRLIFNLAETFFGEQIKQVKELMKGKVQSYMPSLKY